MRIQGLAHDRCRDTKPLVRRCGLMLLESLLLLKGSMNDEMCGHLVADDVRVLEEAAESDMVRK